MTTPAQAASAVLVSIGNSRSATARCGPGGALSDLRRLPSASLDLAALDPGPEPVHVIAVVDDVARQLTAALRRTGRGVTWWGVDREIPVRHPYSAPEAPGADRLVAALAAFDRVGGACVVVDAGTAVTVDVVGADGSFLGGAIAPGLVALREGLRARAPALPPPAANPPPYPGQSSAAAVGLGIAAAFSGALRALVAQALGVAGDVPVVVTGGDSVPAADALTSFQPRIVPELVLEGLARLAATP